MTTWQVTAISIYSCVLAAAAIRHVVLTIAQRKLRWLSPDSPKMSGPELPLVSIMVPAKDEEAAIEGCLRSLLAQTYPQFEVLVVDDRSTDRTAAIVERIATEDSRVKLVRITQLPAGWTGKTHALHQCQQLAKGEWLLFVDADTRHHPDSLSVVLRDAIDHEVDLESLLPALESQTFWEKVIQPLAGICLMVLFPLDKVNRPNHPEKGFANGQYILIRRRAYDMIGGHEAVRDKFVEDIHLGRNIRAAGLGLRVVMGSDIASVRMYSSLSGIVRGWSRILYSAVDFKPAKLYLLFASVVIFSLLSYVMVIATGSLLLLGHRSEFIWILFWMGVSHQVLQTSLMARIYALSRSQRRYIVFRIISVFVMLYILAKTIRMCQTHNVTWRGTIYDRRIQKENTGPAAIS